jgi:hypothetical protein
MRSGMVCADAVALFADDEQQAEIANTRDEKALGGDEHRRDDALGVAGAAAPDEGLILTKRDAGRYGIHVGGERYDRRAEGREHIPALRVDFDSARDSVVSGAEPGQVVVEIETDLFFFRSYGRDLDQRSRQLKYVHSSTCMVCAKCKASCFPDEEGERGE